MSTREDQLLHTVAALADSLVDDFDVVELLQVLIDECTMIFDIVAAGILLRGPGGELEVIVSTSERSEFVGLMQLRIGEGPCVEAVTTGQVVSVPDLSHISDRWPAFASAATESGFASMHAIPMRLRSITIGSLNLFGERIGALNEPDATAAKTLADIATISILQQRTVEESVLAQAQLQRALDSRVVIEQAKGYVAQLEGIDMEAAFHRIRAHARSTQTRLSDVADAIITGRLTV
ncbi:GAF and ANTAR domain-containing protein [Microbacterium sp. ABRD28]|uniref:GAF and ANTAR domain-containing protein n=1 Tax=Microbacterium sp. ABRD28 TaxID=2268461 RepID=UPI000F550C10|nr:GAF and ANTAR domain-containing protein [Microbacterium sp. ABRD28]AZC13306.1 ANTAR domain-containing protein [Microbacterium sp. ABRD28]